MSDQEEAKLYFFEAALSELIKEFGEPEWTQMFVLSFLRPTDNEAGKRSVLNLFSVYERSKMIDIARKTEPGELFWNRWFQTLSGNGIGRQGDPNEGGDDRFKFMTGR